MISPIARQAVYGRSGGHCEAIIEISLPSDRFIRGSCGQRATEIHHRLTRARGGDVLDLYHEIYHLIHLCHECHSLSQGYSEDYEGGMLIAGFVIWNADRSWPLYIGPDKYLTDVYGKQVNGPHQDNQGTEPESSGDPKAG